MPTSSHFCLGIFVCLHAVSLIKFLKSLEKKLNLWTKPNDCILAVAAWGHVLPGANVFVATPTPEIRSPIVIFMVTMMALVWTVNSMLSCRCKISEFHIFAPPSAAPPLHSAARGRCHPCPPSRCHCILGQFLVHLHSHSRSCEDKYVQKRALRSSISYFLTSRSWHMNVEAANDVDPKY